MKRWLIFIYGVTCYAIAFVTLLYAIGFVGNLWVPKSIDSAPRVSMGLALLIDAVLLGLFAIQHSVMARPRFKRWWTRIVPKEAERSTYILFAAIALIVMFVYWEPLGGTVWDVQSPIARQVLYGGYAFAIATTAYILIAIQLEEHDLLAEHPEYAQYRKRVPMLVPFLKRLSR